MLEALFVFLALAAVLYWQGVLVVPEGHAWTVERLGRFHGLLGPGAHLVLPFLDRAGARICLMENAMEVSVPASVTRDNVILGVDGLFRFVVHDPQAAAYRVRDVETAMRGVARSAIHKLVSESTVDDFITGRADRNRRLSEIVESAVAGWGVTLKEASLANIDPPKEITEAVTRLIAARRWQEADALAAENARREAEAARERASARLTAAQDEAQAVRLLADAEAGAVQCKAAAQAAANREIQGSLSGPNAEILLAARCADALQALASAPAGLARHAQKALPAAVELITPVVARAARRTKQAKAADKNHRARPSRAKTASRNGTTPKAAASKTESATQSL